MLPNLFYKFFFCFLFAAKLHIIKIIILLIHKSSLLGKSRLIYVELHNLVLGIYLLHNHIMYEKSKVLLHSVNINSYIEINLKNGSIQNPNMICISRIYFTLLFIAAWQSSGQSAGLACCRSWVRVPPGIEIFS